MRTNLVADSGRVSLPRTVVVIGASGFIGRNLVRHLKHEVSHVIPVSRSGAEVEGIPGFRLEELTHLDVGSEAALIHAAAYRYDALRFAADQAQILLRNVEILGNVYEFCARSGIMEVRVAGSVAVYPADNALFDDAAPIDLNRDPQDSELMYAWSKRIGEVYARLFARKFGINTVTFRLSNPFGPHDSLDPEKAHVVPAFIMRALMTTGPFAVRGNPQASRDFIYVGDVCEVLRRSLGLRGHCATYNLGSGQNVTIEQLARTILRLVGRESEIVASGAATSAVAHRRCSNNRVRTDFAMAFTTLEDALRPTIAWYRDACC